MYSEHVAMSTQEELLHFAHGVINPGEQMVALFGIEARIRDHYDYARQEDELCHFGVFGDETTDTRPHSASISAEDTLTALHLTRDKVRTLYGLGQLAHGLKMDKLHGAWSDRRIHVEALNPEQEPFTYDIGGFGEKKPTDIAQGRVDLSRYSTNHPVPDEEIGNLFLSENRPVGPSVTTLYTAGLVNLRGEPLAHVTFLYP